MPQPTRILIVDDDTLDRQAVVRAFKRGASRIDGMETDVEEADTLAGTRQALLSREFACVFLDHNLPDGTAPELIREVRARGLAVPFIVLTGQRDERAIVEVMKAGATDYLNKDDLDPTLLGRALRSALHLATVQREHQAAHQRTVAILGSITDAFVVLDTEWRCTYLNDQAEQMVLQKREEVLGRDFWDAFSMEAGSALGRQCRRAVDERVPVTFEEFFAPLNTWFEVRAFPSDEGLSIFFRDISGRKEWEIERERLAESNRLLLDSTGDGIYGIDTEGRFTFINRAALRMLGLTREQVLGRNGHSLIHHTRPGGAQYPETECPIYRSLRSGESAHVEEDVFWRGDGAAFPVAYSASPILEGGAVRGVVVTFSDISERKAQDAERERLAERERNIAGQLQSALQPDLPGVVPGLAVTRYYEAALTEEASVGGDFYDVFAVEKGCTVLAVGDLSGKGLQAATQVSMVRNMLRAFLYSKPTVAEAVTDLNRVLVENNLLMGFSTLFVGAFDGGTRELNYVNCGQEPALARRAGTGAVEYLTPTGPILGSIENAQYAEASITLAPGDALAVFTDGLTEVGATRRAMLGIEGVADLLREVVGEEPLRDAAAMAELLALRLIGGVDAAAQGGVMRDDVCLLLAVVEGGP